MSLSRLDGTGVKGIHRRAVEEEIVAIQELLAKQANTLTVYTLQAEVERRVLAHGGSVAHVAAGR